MKLADIIAKRKEQAETRKMKGDKAFSFKEGRTQFRILPGWRKDDETFFHDFGMHFIKDDAGKNVAVHVCPKATYDQECPTCNSINQAFNFVRENPSAADDAMVDRLKEANSGSRILMNAVVRAGAAGHDIKEDTVVVLDLPRAQFENAILALFEEYGEELLDTSEGLDIVCSADGKGFDRKYSFVPASKKSNVPTVTQQQLDDRPDIDKWIKAQNWEQERVQKAISTVGSIVGLEYNGGAAALPNRSNLSIAGATEAKAQANRAQLDDMLDSAIDDAEFEDVIMDANGVHTSESEANKAAEEAAAKAQAEAQAKVAAEAAEAAAAVAAQKAAEEEQAKKVVNGGSSSVADDLSDILEDLNLLDSM